MSGVQSATRVSRSRTIPQEAGLALYGDRRRVSGLRREELAGVSSSYYTLLEQGQSHNASPQVLDAIASALHLNDAERLHLRRLGERTGRRSMPERPVRDVADPALVELLESLGDVPAMVLGRRSDVLAWNPFGHALLAGHLSAEAPTSQRTRPNMAALVFLDDDTRHLYVDWRSKSRAVVGNLRLTVGQHPDDPVLASLVGSLGIASETCGSLWADHRVQACTTAEYEMHHPLVGKLTVTQQSLRSIENPDQTLLTHTASAGSPSAEALRLLVQLVGDQRDEIAPAILRAQQP